MQRRVLGLAAAAVGLSGVLGCSSGSSPLPPARTKPFVGVRLAVGAVGDPAFAAVVSAQRGEWQESRGGEVDLRPGELDPKDARGVEVILFRGDRLGELVDAGALAVLPDAVVKPPRPEVAEPTESGAGTPGPPPDPLAWADVLPGFADQVTKYGRDRLALPLGGSALVLAYRREALEGEALQAAAKEAGVALAPPRTWEGLDALARFLHGRDWDGDGRPEAGLALALGADAEGVGTATVLARAAALGQHRDQFSFLFDADSMEPRIASPPFVEALKATVDLKACGPEGVETFDGEAARAAFRDGRAALLIDRAERATRWADPKAARKVGVAPLPGSGRVFEPEAGAWEDAAPPNRPSYLPFGGGWLVGVSAAATGAKREAAVDFARYLAGPETANRIRVEGDLASLPVHQGQLGPQGLPDPRAARGVEARLWVQAVAQTLTASRIVPGLRIPGAVGYLADLDRARVAAVGGKPADRALEAAARAWAGRTGSLGPKRQLWHYRRSLNALPTDPEPPAR